MDLAGVAFRLDEDTHQNENYLCHLYELRATIELEATALAALRGTKKDLELVRERYKDLKNALASGRDGTDESRAFHKAVIDASGNPHMASFVGWVGNKIWSFMRERDWQDYTEIFWEAQREHEAIIEAISNREVAKAKELARQHVINAARRHGIKIQIP
jgi:DNA-binding FadR family transcriptional regulator